MEIKSGNSVIFEVTIKDQNGDLLENLASTTEIKYLVKVKKTDPDTEAKITATKTGGAISINTPSTGIIQISLTSTDTDIEAERYFQAIQLDYAGTIQELDLIENSQTINTLIIEQDIIEN